MRNFFIKISRNKLKKLSSSVKRAVYRDFRRIFARNLYLVAVCASALGAVCCCVSLSGTINKEYNGKKKERVAAA